jgi:hypothetical protein
MQFPKFCDLWLFEMPNDGESKKTVIVSVLHNH